MIFTYRALKDGQTIRGRIEAHDEKEAIAYLKSNGYFPLEVKGNEQQGDSLLRTFFNRVSLNDLTYMTRQLSIMISSGLTLIDGLEIIKKQSGDTPLHRVIDGIDKQLREGKSFSEALAQYPQVFSHFYIAIVKAGEASGKLNTVLLKLAETLEKQREIRQRLKNAMIYPAAVISAMLAMMFIMITFVIPRLLSLYKEFNIELPWSTQMLINISSFSAAYWPLIIVATGIAVFTLSQFAKTSQGKLLFDRGILHVPVMNSIIKISILTDATRTLAILIGSGVSILDGLTIIAEGTDNRIYQHAFHEIRDQIEKGAALGNAMANQQIFPISLIQMTTVGEQTGHLDETLMKISEFYEMESELMTKNVMTLMEPIMLVVLAVGVGFLIFAVITPILKLTSSFE